ncbi:MAG: hypothetical protein WD096_10415 [Actinomycetota bacterium]
MFSPEAGMKVKVRREGRRTTTIQANISDESWGLLSITMRNGEEGCWAPIVGGEKVAIFAMSKMPANDFGLAQDFPFVVDPVDGDEPPTLVESVHDVGKVARGYGQDTDELFAYLADLAADVLS